MMYQFLPKSRDYKETAFSWALIFSVLVFDDTWMHSEWTAMPQHTTSHFTPYWHHARSSPNPFPSSPLTWKIEQNCIFNAWHNTNAQSMTDEMIFRFIGFAGGSKARWQNNSQVILLLLGGKKWNTDAIFEEYDFIWQSSDYKVTSPLSTLPPHSVLSDWSFLKISL